MTLSRVITGRGIGPRSRAGGRTRLLPFALCFAKRPSNHCNTTDEGEDTTPSTVDGAKEPLFHHGNGSVVDEEGGSGTEDAGEETVALRV